MAVFGASGVINRALTIILLPLYTNYIRLDEYGVLALLTIILSTLPLVLRMGLNNALLRSFYDYSEEERPRLATTVMIFLLATSVPLLLIMAFFSPQISMLVFDSSQYTLHLRIVCIIAFLEVFNAIPHTLMLVRNASVKYSACQIIGFIVQLSIIIILVKYYRIGILGVLIGNLVGSALENGLMFWFTKHQLRWGFNVSELKKMLIFGFPLIFSRLSSICLQSIDRFFLNYYSTTLIVGLYALGNQLVNPIALLITSPFIMIWTNMQFSSMNDSDAKEYYARMLTYIVYLASLLALPVSVLAEDILRIFASSKYWDATVVVPWLALTAVFDAANPALSVGISLKRKTYFNPIILTTAALVNLGLNFLLIPDFGMLGAAIATLISYIVMGVIKYKVSNYLFPVNYEWQRILKIVIASFLLFLFSCAIKIDHPILSFLAHFPLAVALPFVLILLGFYDDKERAKAQEMLKHAKELISNKWHMGLV
ncbi:MAG: Membrane protein [bacterium]|nr:MAG: Membrane protein [bacterium]